MAGKESGGRNAPTAVRMRRLREVLGYKTSLSFATYLGISPQRLNNVENGSPISSALSALICRKVPGMTEDWLRHEKLDGLPYQLAVRLAPGSAGKGKSTPSV